MLIITDEESKLNTTVYRKPTLTDQYLHWDSHHAIPSKYSVIGTLYHRAKTICFQPMTVAERRSTSVQNSEKMPVSNMGHQQSQVEEPSTGPKAKQREHQ